MVGGGWGAALPLPPVHLSPSLAPLPVVPPLNPTDLQHKIGILYPIHEH